MRRRRVIVVQLVVFDVSVNKRRSESGEEGVLKYAVCLRTRFPFHLPNVEETIAAVQNPAIAVALLRLHANIVTVAFGLRGRRLSE